MTEKALAHQEAEASPVANLAVTAALGHFTATLADLLLSSPDVRDHFGHDEVRNLFLWHALEESGHQAVAFDVYRAVGGTEPVRVRTMRMTRVRLPA